MTKNYVWLNGQFFADDQAIFSVHNRAFQYGDGIFETIHAFGTTARHLEIHCKRMVKGMKLLNLEVPSFFSVAFLENEISRLLNKNRIFGSARVRVTAFRTDGGFFTPTTSKVSLVIESKPLQNNFYEFNKKGLIVDFFTQLRKPINDLSSLKTCSSLLYVMAGLHKAKLGVDDCLLINDQNRVAEAISSNLFFAVGENLYTPALDEGCVEGVMRHLVIAQAEKLKIKVFDKAMVEPSELLLADELFLTNAVKGIQWVVGLKDRRYFSSISRAISREVNRITFPDQFKDGFSG